MIVIEVSVNNNVYIGISVVSGVVVSPAFVYDSVSSFHSELSEAFLGFSVVNIQVYINVPHLWVLVSFFDKEQLFT